MSHADGARILFVYGTPEPKGDEVLKEVAIFLRENVGADDYRR